MPKKCDWPKSELAFLGHLVGAEGIKVDPAKIQVVKDSLHLGTSRSCSSS